MKQFTRAAWNAVAMTAAAAALACGQADEDESAPFDAVADATGSGSVYGLRASSSSIRKLCSACSARAWSPDRKRVLVNAGGDLQVLTAGAPASRLELDLEGGPLGGIPQSWQLQSAWSADSAWLAYVWNGARTFLAGSDALLAGHASQAVWAPSSARLALGRAPSKQDHLLGQLSVWSADSAVDVPTDSYSSGRVVSAIA